MKVNLLFRGVLSLTQSVILSLALGPKGFLEKVLWAVRSAHQPKILHIYTRWAIKNVPLFSTLTLAFI